MGKDLPTKRSDEAVLMQKGYKLFKKIGEGSYAPVYFTEYIGTKASEPKKLACKVIDLRKAPKDYVKKFLPRELEILAIVNHPHIVHVQSIFQRKSRYYIFMTMAEKGDLLDYLLTNGPLNENRARVWFKQIALAVQYLHEMGVAHRDLKCENCLISANNNLKLADFGFARFIVNNEGKNVTSSTYCGSLNYAAPEVLKGTPYYPKCSDCWSLGVILFAMLNKAMPFEDKNVKELINQQMQRKWKFRSKVVDVLSPEVHVIVNRLLEPDPLQRLDANNAVISPWIFMDPRLTKMSPDEEKCLMRAREEFNKYLDGQKKVATPNNLNPAHINTFSPNLNEYKVQQSNIQTESKPAVTKSK